MVAFNSISNYTAIAYPTVKILCAFKYVNHCLVSVVDIGDGGVVWCVEEGVFNSEFMGKGEGKKIGSPCIAAWGAMGTKDCLEVFIVFSSNVGVDVSAHYDLQIFWDLLKD